MINNLEILEACRRAFSWKQISTILILTVGLTLTTVMFAVGYGYSVFSIPFKDSEQLVSLGQPQINEYTGQVLYDDSGYIKLNGVTPSLFFELKERKDIFTDIAAYKDQTQVIMAPKQNTKFMGYDVTDNYFDVLGVSFRGLSEWKQSSETKYPVPLIVTHGTGMKDFGYDAIGKEFDTESSKVTLFGILPEGFLSISPYREENSGFSPLILNRVDTVMVDVIARLAPGITPKLAEQMLAGYAVQPAFPGSLSDNPLDQMLAKHFASIPKDPNASRLFVRPVFEKMLQPTRRVALGAWLMGGLILVLCIASVAGIYLMRCNYQLGEFALKSALGATFINLIRLHFRSNEQRYQRKCLQLPEGYSFSVFWQTRLSSK